MGRDFKEQYGTGTLEKGIKISPPGSFHTEGPGTHVLRTEYWNNVVLRTERDYLKFSDGHSPTNYWGYEYTASPVAFEQWANPSWHWNHLDQNFVRGAINPFGNRFGVENCYVWDNFCFPNDLDEKADNKCLNALAEAPVDLGQFLGELPETVMFMAESAIRVFTAYRAIRGRPGPATVRDYRKAARALGLGGADIPKKGADSWLSWKFGWEPFLSDIYEMSKVADHLIGLVRGKRKTVRRTVSRKSNCTVLLPPNYWEHDDITKGTTTSVTFAIEDEWLHGMEGLGLLNPAAIAWELAPLSFVFDWFVPVENLIRGLSATTGLRFLHGYRTRWVRGSATGRKRHDWPWNGDPPGLTIRPKGMSRQALETWPRPHLTTSNGLNAGKVNTLLALIASSRR